MEIAEQLAQKGEYHDAIIILDNIIKENPQFIRAYTFKASYLSVIPGRESDAIKVLDDAIGIIPDCYSCYYTRGLLTSGPEAISDATIAIEGNKTDYGGYELRAMLRREEGDFTGAIEDVNKAIELNPLLIKDSIILTTRAGCYIELGEFEKANKDIELVLELDSTSNDAYFLMSMNLLKSGQSVKEAKHYFELAKKYGLEQEVAIVVEKLFE